MHLSASIVHLLLINVVVLVVETLVHIVEDLKFCFIKSVTGDTVCDMLCESCDLTFRLIFEFCVKDLNKISPHLEIQLQKYYLIVMSSYIMIK